MANDLVGVMDIDSLCKEIECVVCLNNARVGRMCVHCSAIICTPCTTNWIEKRRCCPKCSHVAEGKDFVHCHLADKVIEFIESFKKDECTKHPKETIRVYCSTCARHVCFDCIRVDGQHLGHDYHYVDEDFQNILTTNHKFLAFIRQRIHDNQANLNDEQLTIQRLLTEHDRNLASQAGNRPATDVLVQHTEDLFDSHQREQEECHRVIEADLLLLTEIERRLKDARKLSAQEEILQMLQKQLSNHGAFDAVGSRFA